ncbi:MAG TPA: hypothetical protein VF841_16760 [Anaeromyxobacter sp.]
MTPARRDWVDPYRAAVTAGCAAYAARAKSPPEDPLLVAAIGLRETWLGNMPGYTPRGSPDGVGDHGHGRGLFQIDDRGPFAHLIKPAPWAVEDQAAACCAALDDARHELQPYVNSARYLLGVVCAYNAGPEHVRRYLTKGWDPNRCTFGGDYGDDVLAVYHTLLSQPGWPTGVPPTPPDPPEES